MGDLLRLLALDGPVMSLGVLVALAWLIVRLESTRSENAAAHAGITRNIEGMHQQLRNDLDRMQQQFAGEIDRVQQQLTKEIEGVKQDVRDVKQDVRMLTAHLLREKDARPEA